MPDAQMKFNIDITNFQDKCRAAQSLINFILDNGALYIYGDYGTGDNNTQTEMSNMVGIVRTDYYMENHYGTGNSWNVYPYGYDVFMMYVSSAPDTIYLKSYEPIKDVTTTLTQTRSAFKMYKTYYTSNGVRSDVYGSSAVNATITPMIGDTINLDTTLRPSDLPYTAAWVSHVRVPIDKTNMELKYDYQLRTPTFMIEYYDSIEEDCVIDDVFYKIGFCGVNMMDSSTQSLVNSVANNGFSFEPRGASGSVVTYLRLIDSSSVRVQLDTTVNGSSRPADSKLVIRDRSSDWNAGLPTSMLLPLITDANGNTISGFMYARLYRSNGDLFNGKLHGGYRGAGDSTSYSEDPIGELPFGWRIYSKTSANDANPICADLDSIQIPFTSDHLNDNAFIAWVIPSQVNN